MSYGLRDLGGVRVELCDECGFDGREPRDVATSVREVLTAMTRLAAHPDAVRRPEPDTWSGTEYVEHSVEVAGEIVAIVDRAVGRRSASSPTTLPETATVVTDLVRDLSATDWDVATDGWPIEVSVRNALLHLLHDLEHHLWDVRRGYARLALADGVEVVTSR